MDIDRTIGRCIYCGSTDDLSDEHIIPYGLGATWVLRKASCKRHRDITSKFELDVQRNLWGLIRAAIGTPSRKGHAGKLLKVMLKTEAGLETDVDLDPALVGAPIEFIRLPLPRYLSGIKQTGSLSVIGNVMHYFPDPERFRRELRAQYGPGQVSFSTTFQPVAFAQMLAKIALGFTIARFGLEGIKKCYIIPAIDDGTGIGQWVGCIDDGITLSEGTNDFEISGGFINTPTRDIVVEVRLFGKLKTPTYIVVVGEPKDNLKGEVTFQATIPAGSVDQLEIIRRSSESWVIPVPAPPAPE
jgi:hypothetical protein